MALGARFGGSCRVGSRDAFPAFLVSRPPVLTHRRRTNTVDSELSMQFRRHALTRIVAVLLGVALFAETTGWGHTGWDDPGCDPVPVLHSQTVERLTTGTALPSPESQHCVLCHLLQLLNLGISAQAATAAVQAAAEPHWHSDAAVHLALLCHHASGRSPPPLASSVAL
jgi:hypothetical protein